MNRLPPASRAGLVYLTESWGFARCARFTPGFMLSSAPRTFRIRITSMAQQESYFSFSNLVSGRPTLRSSNRRRDHLYRKQPLG